MSRYRLGEIANDEKLLLVRMRITPGAEPVCSCGEMYIVGLSVGSGRSIAAIDLGGGAPTELGVEDGPGLPETVRDTKPPFEAEEEECNCQQTEENAFCYSCGFVHRSISA